MVIIHFYFQFYFKFFSYYLNNVYTINQIIVVSVKDLYKHIN